jgi:1,2-diacylglycerol 3-beta-glucosyltransferase
VIDRRPMLRTRATKTVAATCAAAGAASGAHLLALLAAVMRDGRRPTPHSCNSLRLAVVIPAHNEETQIAATLKSIRASRYPVANLRVLVVADNCLDETAAVARCSGAEVWERWDPSRRGKGHALEWAFSRLIADEAIDAVCVVDADCQISRNLLSSMAARLGAGAEAVQAPYLISNPDASDAAALRWAAFALFNVVRPLGRHRLGLSTGLLGTGMAFSRRLLMRSPWCAFSYAEDREQHMRWVLDGVRVDCAPEADVRSPAPITAGGGKTQMARWDSGRGRLAARLTPSLMLRWLRTGDVTALDAALEPLLPPQSLLFAINLAAVGASRLARARVTAYVATASMLAQAGYVTGGLAALNAPPAVWRALLTVPRFVLLRLAGLLRSLTGRGPGGWERTERDAEPAHDDRAGSETSPRIPSVPPMS